MRQMVIGGWKTVHGEMFKVVEIDVRRLGIDNA